MKKIPFNLDDARNGREIYINEILFHFVGLDGAGNVITEDDYGRLGRYLQDDVFHLPKTVTKYVNLYYDYTFHCIIYQYKEFNSYEDAVNNKFGDAVYTSSENIKYLKTVDVEIEEDY